MEAFPFAGWEVEYQPRIWSQMIQLCCAYCLHVFLFVVLSNPSSLACHITQKLVKDKLQNAFRLAEFFIIKDAEECHRGYKWKTFKCVFVFFSSIFEPV